MDPSARILRERSTTRTLAGSVPENSGDDYTRLVIRGLCTMEHPGHIRSREPGDGSLNRAAISIERIRPPGRRYRPSVGVGRDSVLDITEGPPHVLDDLHAFEGGLQRVDLVGITANPASFGQAVEERLATSPTADRPLRQSVLPQESQAQPRGVGGLQSRLHSLALRSRDRGRVTGRRSSRSGWTGQ